MISTIDKQEALPFKAAHSFATMKLETLNGKNEQLTYCSSSYSTAFIH